MSSRGLWTRSKARPSPGARNGTTRDRTTASGTAGAPPPLPRCRLAQRSATSAVHAGGPNRPRIAHKALLERAPPGWHVTRNPFTGLESDSWTFSDKHGE